MYGREIVRSLQRFKKISIDSSFHPAIDITIDGINKAQHFYLEDLESVIAPVRSIFRKEGELFTGSTAIDINPPYPITLFMYDIDSRADVPKEQRCEKRALLVIEHADDNLLEVRPIMYNESYNIWVLSISKFMISTNERDIVKEFVDTMPNYMSQELLLHTQRIKHIIPLPIVNMKDFPDFVSRVGEAAAEDMEDIGILNAILLLINCKNITITCNRAKPIKGLKVNKKNKIRHLYNYKTLSLVLPTVSKNYTNGSTNSGSKKSIHLCRGHFKQLKTGRYWWNAQIRGSKKEGVTVKDYTIKT